MAAVLARLIDPAAFGIVALATLTLRFANHLARGGIAQAVVQKPDLDAQDIRAAMTASSVLGLAFMASIWIGAPIAGRLFSDADLVPVLRWMALDLVFFGFSATADALLRRELAFRTLAIRNVVSYVVGYVAVGLPLAIAGAGVWSLVAAILSQSGIRALLTVAARRHPAVPTFRAGPHRAILAFGGRVSIISVLEFLGTELDTIAVGRYLGSEAVGLYNRAYLLVKLPLQELTTSLSRVLFPAFASVQREDIRVRRAYLSALRLTSAATIPVAMGMAVAREELVLVLLGPRWTDATVVVPFIALAAALNTLSHICAVVAEARARLNPKIAITLLKVAVLLGLLALARDRGLAWYGAALAGADLISHISYLRLTSSVAGVPARRSMVTYLPAVAAGLIVAGVIGAGRIATITLGWPTAAVLATEVALGGIVLLGTLRYGPLAATKRDLLGRLESAGIGRGTRSGRFLDRALRGRGSSVPG